MSDTDDSTLADLAKMGLIEVTDDHAPAVVPEPVAEVVVPEPGQIKIEDEELFPGFNSLPEESRKAAKDRFDSIQAAKIDDYERRVREANQARFAIEGKVGPTQRQLAETQRRLAELEGAQKTASKSGSREKIAKFAEQYPDEGEVFGNMQAEFETELEKRDREIQELRSSFADMRQRTERDDSMNQLRQLHPDVAEIDTSPELAEWAQHISPLKQAWLSSSDVNQVAEVLNDFKRDRELARYYSGQPATSAAPATPLTKLRADPNPVPRKTSGASRMGTAGASDEEDQYSNALEMGRALGLDI